MPNWNNNTIICKPDLCKYILNEDEEVDFNILVPEPETKEECLREFGEKYIDNGDKHLDHSEGREWFNWYDWRCDFWGTKWGACDTSVDKEGNDYYFITFDTAWCPPYIWLNKLSSLGKPFILYEEEEGGEGSIQCYHGQIDLQRDWKRNWNIEDSEDDPDYNNDFPDLELIK